MTAPEDLARLLAPLTAVQQAAVVAFARRLLTGTHRRGEPTPHLRADGRWQIALEVPSTTGRRQRKVLYHRTPKGAIAAYRAAQRALEAHQLAQAPARLTLDAYLDQWLHDVAEPRVDAGTAELYARTLRTWIRPGLGTVPLVRLTPAAIQRHYRGLLDAGLAPGSIRLAHRILRSALVHAVNTGLLGRNPTTGVSLPKLARSKKRSLSVEEAQRVLRAARGDPLEPLWVLALTTALRQGELLALRWEDVDLAGATLHVRRRLARVGGQWDHGDPKTARSMRTLPLVPLGVAALRRHRARARTDTICVKTQPLSIHGVTAPSLVFTAPGGGPMYAVRAREAWERLMLAADVRPRVTFHELRHSTGSLLLALGTPLAVVAQVLGHASPQVTASVYTHEVAGEGGRRLALEALATALEGD